MRRALLFFPHNPFPPQSGAHRRCLAMLAALKELGYQVTLASSRYTSQTRWDSVSEPDLVAAGNPTLAIHTPTPADRRYLHYWRLWRRYLRRPTSLKSPKYVAPSMKTWFAELTRTLKPDVVMVSYALYDAVVPSAAHRTTLTCIDVYDIVTLLQARFEALNRALPSPPVSPARTDPALLDENYFDKMGTAISPAEYRIYDKYACTIAITPADGAHIQSHAPHTRVSVIPMTFAAVPLANTYAGPAIFTTGPNPFNVQGYLYFVGRVLPLLRERVPDFQLDVTGTAAQTVEPAEGVTLCGFLQNLTPLYAAACFMACPILGKTGQLVKITEAMAHGLPVVALERVAEGSPLCHGETGYIARNAHEFAEYCARLWNDRAMCRRMGDAARHVIAAEYPPARLSTSLSQTLSR